MRAAVLRDHHHEPTLEHRPDPVPGPGEVVVAMRVSGICGSDLHIVDGSTVPARLPIVLGHEASGTVTRTGEPVDGVDDVVGVAPGDRVTVNPMIACGRCGPCRRGSTNYCKDIRILGLHVDGAHAEQFVVPARNVVPLPAGVDFALGAIVADAVATPLRAILAAGVAPGAVVAVFGLGGLGLHAAVLLRQVFGVEVIGVDAGDAALERAASFGIATVVDARAGRASDRIRELTGGGVAASFEFVGSVDVVEQAVRSLDHGGICTVVGVGPDRLGLSLRQETLVARGLRIAGSHGYLTEDIVQLLAWLDAGTLTLDGTVTHRFPLADYASGLATLRDRTANAIRVVVTPD